MPHTVREKKQLLARIRRFKGQAEALEEAIKSEAECSAILQQIAAIRGAVNGLMGQVIEGHLREHVAAATSAKQRLEDLEPVLRVLRSYMK